MSVKNFFILSVVTIIILNSASVHSQSIKPRQLLKKVQTAVSTVNTVIYKINRRDKHFTSRDTVYEVAICSLYLAPKDEMKMYHIVDKKSSYKDRYAHYEYDGNYAAVVSYKRDSLDIPKKIFLANVQEKGHDGTISMGYGLVLRDIFQKNNIFRQARSLIARFAIDRMEVTEDIFMDESVYILSIYGKSREGRIDYINNEVHTFYIRKSDFMPVGYSNYGELEGMKNYEYYEVEYLAINSQLSADDFKVDFDVKEIKPKIYYEELQQYDIN